MSALDPLPSFGLGTSVQVGEPAFTEASWCPPEPPIASMPVRRHSESKLLDTRAVINRLIVPPIYTGATRSGASLSGKHPRRRSGSKFPALLVLESIVCQPPTVAEVVGCALPQDNQVESSPAGTNRSRSASSLPNEHGSERSVKTGLLVASPTASSLFSGLARSQTPRTGRPDPYESRHHAEGGAPRFARGRPRRAHPRRRGWRL